MGNCRVRDASARNEHANAARNAEAFRTHAGNSAVDRPKFARGRRYKPAWRTADLSGLRRDSGRWRYALRFDHGCIRRSRSGVPKTFEEQHDQDESDLERSRSGKRWNNRRHADPGPCLYRGFVRRRRYESRLHRLRQVHRDSGHRGTRAVLSRSDGRNAKAWRDRRKQIIRDPKKRLGGLVYLRRRIAPGVAFAIFAPSHTFTPFTKTA